MQSHEDNPVRPTPYYYAPGLVLVEHSVGSNTNNA